MKFIVTGAAGLIGSAVVYALNKQGVTDILAVDHLGTSEKWKNLRGLQFADYMEKDMFLAMLQNNDLPDDIQAVIHLGACSSTTERDATYLVHNNFEFSKLLAVRTLKRNARFLYASSAATYGGGEHGYHDDDSKIEELRPLNMYGYSKQMFDLWAKRHGMLDKIAGMKFTNVFGPNEKHKGPMRSMVCRAFEQIQEAGQVSLFRSYREEYADGEQQRDFIYVKDAVNMIIFLMIHPDLNGLYNIGSGKAETWNSLVKAVFDAMDLPCKIRYIDMPDELKGKYQYYTCADMSKIQSAGYKLTDHTLQDAVRDYVRGYLIPGKHLAD